MATTSIAENTRPIIEQAVYESLLRLCGGGIFLEERREKEQVIPDPNVIPPTHDDWKSALKQLAMKSVSFPNGNNHKSSEGKPHDIEVRVALSLFHRYNHKKNNINHKGGGRKRQRQTNTIARNSLELLSDFGLKRSFASAAALGNILAMDLEQHSSHLRQLVDYVDCQKSGMICFTTKTRVEQLKASGKLLCCHCHKWCKGEKGLWWHSQKEHGVTHDTATRDANHVQAKDSSALVVYNHLSNHHLVFFNDTTNNHDNHKDTTSPENDQDSSPFVYAKIGDLQRLVECFQTTGLDPPTATDRNGSTCLHWAAGGGHLPIVQFLIQSKHCDPNTGQRGKRSFRGRTALHWASRNGHLAVVQYLIEEAKANLEAATIDGTTAFGWACWQGRIHVIRYLYSQGCNPRSVNTFGCNAALWAAQGNGGLQVLNFLAAIGCNLHLVNSNGHGVLHKAAQRGNRPVLEWLLGESARKDRRLTMGPDLDGHLPSDLARMEGHVEISKWLTQKENDSSAKGEYEEKRPRQ